jgi:hypothetical protein
MFYTNTCSPVNSRVTSPPAYLLVLTPRIARLIDEIHEHGANIPAVFARYDSEILS